MIRESRHDKEGWGTKLQFAVMQGNRKRWLYQRDVPNDLVQEYRNYVNEAKGKPDKEGNFRGAMMIVANIEAETERLQKLKRPTKAPLVRPKPVPKKDQVRKGSKQAIDKKKQTSKIKEKKKLGYYAQKKIEKNQKLKKLNEDYHARRDNTLEQSNNYRLVHK
jgi:hypothetical protein